MAIIAMSNMFLHVCPHTVFISIYDKYRVEGYCGTWIPTTYISRHDSHIDHTEDSAIFYG